MTRPASVKNPWFIVVLSIIGSTIPFSAWAVDACDQDRPKVCGGVSPGEGQIHHCMMEKIDQLSPACQKTVMKADALYQSLEQKCGNDIQRFCSQHGPAGEARVLDCLRTHKSEVTAPCRKVFTDYKALNYRVKQ